MGHHGNRSLRESRGPPSRLKEGRMSQATEEFIETVDARQLQKHDWPILRLFAGSFLDRLALARYQRRVACLRPLGAAAR